MQLRYEACRLVCFEPSFRCARSCLCVSLPLAGTAFGPAGQVMVVHLPFVVDPAAQLDAVGSTFRRVAGGEVSRLEGPYRTIMACGPAANGLALGYRAFRVYVWGYGS